MNYKTIAHFQSPTVSHTRLESVEKSKNIPSADSSLEMNHTLSRLSSHYFWSLKKLEAHIQTGVISTCSSDLDANPIQLKLKVCSRRISRSFQIHCGGVSSQKAPLCVHVAIFMDLTVHHRGSRLQVRLTFEQTVVNVTFSAVKTHFLSEQKKHPQPSKEKC